MFMDEGNGAPVTAKHQMLAVQGLDTTGFNNGQQTGRMCAQVDLLSPPTHVFYDFWNAHQPESAYYNIYRDPRQTAAGNQPSSHCTTSGASPVVTDAVKGYTRVWCDVDSIWNFESHQGSNCDNTNWNDPQALQMSVELIQYPWTQRQTNFPTLHGVDVDPADPNILKHMRFCGTQRRTGLCGGHSTGYLVDTDKCRSRTTTRTPAAPTTRCRASSTRPTSSSTRRTARSCRTSGSGACTPCSLSGTPRSPRARRRLQPRRGHRRPDGGRHAATCTGSARRLDADGVNTGSGGRNLRFFSNLIDLPTFVRSSEPPPPPPPTPPAWRRRLRFRRRPRCPCSLALARVCGARDVSRARVHEPRPEQ